MFFLPTRKLWTGFNILELSELQITIFSFNKLGQISPF